MKKITFSQVIDIILIILLIIFAIQNLDNVLVKFITIKFEAPLFIIIIFTFLIGYLTAKIFRREKYKDEK